MASGRVHGMFSMAAGVAAGVALYCVSRDLSAAAVLGGACLAGVIVSPDLDEGNPTTSHNQIQRGLGVSFAAIWWIIWQPYVVLITRHRAFLSHFPVISTIGRVGYLGAILIPVIWGLEYLGKLPSVEKAMVSIAWAGNILQPFLEKIQDLIPLHIEIPGVGMWIGFLAAAAVVTGLAFVFRVDFPQRTQKVMFVAMVGIILLVGGIWALINPIAGMDLIVDIPIGVWAFAGLCLSDSLHAILDWITPRRKPVSILFIL